MHAFMALPARNIELYKEDIAPNLVFTLLFFSLNRVELELSDPIVFNP